MGKNRTNRHADPIKMKFAYQTRGSLTRSGFIPRCRIRGAHNQIPGWAAKYLTIVKFHYEMVIHYEGSFLL